MRHFGASADASGAPLDPVYLAIRVEDELVGVVPLEMCRDLARQLGDPNVCDYTGVLAGAGHEAAVSDALIEWLMEDITTAVELWGVPGDSPLLGGLAAAAEAHGWTCTAEVEAACPRAGLPPGGGFEAYLAGLGKHDRHELRRKLRHLRSAGQATFTSAATPDAVAGGIDQFLHLMRVSREDKDEFLTPTMEAFFRDLGGTFAALGMARLSTLSLDGAATAIVFCLDGADTTYLYNSGYDPAFAPLAVGLLSKAYALEDAIARGKRHFDFLRGDEEYKRRLGGVPTPVYRVRLGA